MKKLKYKVGDKITVRNGCAYGRKHMPSGKAKGKIIEVLSGAVFHPFNYGVRFEGNNIYLVIESEIINKEKVVFT